MKNPSDSLARFLHGIFYYHRDKGMPVIAAKAKMYDEAMNVFIGLFKQERNVPDHALVIFSQAFSRMLNIRGAQLKKEVEVALKNGEDPSQVHITAMHDLKAAKDAIDEFISKYVGTSKKEDTNGA